MAVRLDKVQAVYGGNIESVVLDVDTKNGEHVSIGGLSTMGREVVTADAPTDVTKDEVLIVASEEIVYDERLTTKDFVLKAGKPARAYHYTVGDIVTITDDNINGTSVVNQYLIPVNGSMKLAPAADLTAGTRFAALVIEKTKLFGENATTYRVVSC